MAQKLALLFLQILRGGLRSTLLKLEEQRRPSIYQPTPPSPSLLLSLLLGPGSLPWTLNFFSFGLVALASCFVLVERPDCYLFIFFKVGDTWRRGFSLSSGEDCGRVAIADRESPYSSSRGSSWAPAAATAQCAALTSPASSAGSARGALGAVSSATSSTRSWQSAPRTPCRWGIRGALWDWGKGLWAIRIRDPPGSLFHPFTLASKSPSPPLS